MLKEAPRRWPVWSWPPWVEVGTAAVCAVVAWRLAGTALLWAWGYAAVAGVLLSVVDWRTRRLPDVITLPSCLVLAVLLVPTGDLGPALLGGLALGGAYAVMWFVRPDALGFGDVKLAGVAGMLAGPLGVDRWLAAAMGGLVLGALYAVMLLITRRATMKTQFPLGPFIAAGVLVALW
ncbi:prepilin peptidase [Sphaerisporangium rubeum]|uniref:Leader peptidase (Prepilin peptidase)/N-methyltransferase n=1 Tax=Sphaerisporangium rubeum TaxID=321317 RepID=A0A7X0ID34_9ACTN|nr:leader peptidase (prepilin peptidase)/N-methyltransferase [Sphaerisporangium rubeum]